MMTSRCLLLAVTAGLISVISATNETCEEYYRSDGPRITPCKEEIVLQYGQTYTLKCRANTPIEFIQQDLAEEKIGNLSFIIQTNLTDENAEYKYEAHLELVNVDRYVIGFYACVRKNGNIDKDILNRLTAEPKNTVDISYIYIYVDGTDSLYAPMREFLLSKEEYYVAECKPTTPDVEVDINFASPQTKTPNYVLYSPKIGFVMEQCSKIAYVCLANNTEGNETKSIRWQKDSPAPNVIYESEEFLAGETFSLNCSASYKVNAAVSLVWKLPNDNITVNETSNSKAVTQGIVYRSILIENATQAHAGDYTCSGTFNCGETKDQKSVTVTKKFREPYLNYTLFNKNLEIKVKQANAAFTVSVSSYPRVSYTFYRNGTKLENSTQFKVIDSRGKNREIGLRIFKKSVADSNNYTLSLTNGYPECDKNFTYDVRFLVKPTIKFATTDKTCVKNRMISLQCEVTGLPSSEIKWVFNNGLVSESKKIENVKLYEQKAILDIMCDESVNVTCIATNEIGSANQTRSLLVYELPNGFGINNHNPDKIMRYSAHELATVKCYASIYRFSSVSWKKNGIPVDTVESFSTNFSLVAKLKINSIDVYHAGVYECVGESLDGTTEFDTVDIKVSPLQPPVIYFKEIDGNVQTYQPINMFCQAEGIPPPQIKWFKDKIEFNPGNSTNIDYKNKDVDYRTVNSTIKIKQMGEENSGEYECVAYNKLGEEARRSVKLTLKEAAYIKYVIAIVLIVILLLLLVIYLTWKVKKEKRFRKELAAAGLLYFKEGVTKSLNPDLGIDEQAELLPYNEKFEFPAEKLVLGKQLGAGAFGVVYKAEARGIVNAEETTPVAVKMVKKTADNMYIKALASELKIMVHLGKHVNIVNLLGACTKNVGKRELVVIVEYCKFGNIHNYMQKHREVFIDLFSDTNKEKSFGKVNRGYDSTGSTGVQSDYGTANTQDTLLTNNTHRTGRKNAPSQPTDIKASEGYVQPEWRSNYESDYSYEGRVPRTLTSRDLLAWAFQVARGMEYLANRKVLHGDLAARNILLADDNIVKICDFGLAKSIYKNDEYQKKENSPLPVKWLAIECMTDRIFSTQSDVWSFGIVLWEMFTLAKTPYPNLSPAHLLQFLREGHRLEKPAYSDERIYNLMRRCWEEKPTTRPSFTQLQETLGTFLEDNVRNHYVDLNEVYMEGNTPADGQEDYLAMVSAPDYNNMVTPSPHHYVNEVGDPRRFFPPTPTQVDEEGYLQMSPPNHIFSPKSAGTKFDFDPRKFNSRPSEASTGGSELTPMLTLNNLPRSGSDSDHEGNVSPMSNVCSRIEEEPDDVFDNKQSKQTQNQNAKNVHITNATNPMYISLDLDVDKKPINNSYANILPNGLVK